MKVKVRGGKVIDTNDIVVITLNKKERPAGGGYHTYWEVLVGLTRGGFITADVFSSENRARTYVSYLSGNDLAMEEKLFNRGNVS